MIALINNATGQCDAIVASTAGYDLTGYTQVEAPDDPANWRWVDGQWVARPPSLTEQDAEALDADTRWQAVLDATPEQIETWLTNNVTDLASARRVLKFLIVAIRRLHLRG